MERGPQRGGHRIVGGIGFAVGRVQGRAHRVVVGVVDMLGGTIGKPCLEPPRRFDICPPSVGIECRERGDIFGPDPVTARQCRIGCHPTSSPVPNPPPSQTRIPASVNARWVTGL